MRVIATFAVPLIRGNCEFMSCFDGDLERALNPTDQQMPAYVRTSFPSLIKPVRISGPFYDIMSLVLQSNEWGYIQYPERSQLVVRALLHVGLSTDTQF